MVSLSLSSSPHQRVKRDTGQVMRLVIYAMIPGIITQWLFFGWGVLVQCALATITALATETVILALRKKNVERALSDYSAIVTALLIGVSIPPFLPWWMTVLGTVFAIGMVKQLYGGLGFNLFNPAMAAYVMLLVSFPAAMTMWLPPAGLAQYSLSAMDALSMIFTNYSTSGYDITQLKSAVDGFTMATPLDHVKTALTQGTTYTEALQSSQFTSSWLASGGAGFLWVSLAYLLGGLFLIGTKVINWRIPGSLLLSAVVVALVLHLIDADHYASPLFHLLNGSIMIGAFFIATDPVSASTTPKGRLWYGALIGFWVVIIRTFGGYPDAIAFAVLIINMAVPLIDYYTQPRTYGHKRQG